MHDDYIDYIPSPCPICFDPIWRDTNIITCFYCDKNICLKCYINIDEQCANNNNKLLCPLCRGLFVDYKTENDEENQLSRPARINRSARNRERIIVPINEEDILQQEREIREHNDRVDWEDCKKAAQIILSILFTVCIIFIVIFTYRKWGFYNLNVPKYILRQKIKYNACLG